MITEGFSLLGRYRPGATFLHRIDPRIKLGGVLLAVVLVFSSQQWSQLVFLTVVAVTLIHAGGMEIPLLIKAFKPLRWLLLFTLVIHLILSPGHTLFGITWLSRDGLVLGLMAGLRLVLALTFSSVLTLTCSPAEVAGALAYLLRPLSRLGLAIQGFSVQVMLVLHFIPILREEATAVFGKSDDPGTMEKPPTRLGRIGFYAQNSAQLIFRLVDRADALAAKIADGETAVIDPANLPSPRSWGEVNWYILVVVLPVMIVIFGLLS